ncbi:multidrug resistance efflux pump [Pedobacter sp. CAN_A7]|uniref:HlyD family secretion protein n=1 Tax=Pedobacter sp. CAN_A7 TaxID=2787722 RepID=UPI0018CA0BC5
MRYFIYLCALFLMACGGDKKVAEQAAAEKKDSLSRPENINRVSAIAKVEPEAGLVELSAPQSGIVAVLYKQAGDRVKKGEVILKIDLQNDQLATDVLAKQILTQQARAAADAANIRQYQASLKQKQTEVQVTEKLVATGADTRQNLNTQQKELEVIQANLETARNQAAASIAEIATLKKQQQQARLTASDELIRAKQDGILVTMDARIGAALTALTPFATLAPAGDLILHGEIDEMFSTRVKLGQQVTVNEVGSQAVIARGTVSYLSPILANKSLFYGEPGEASDRRVRPFKVVLDKEYGLLINAKVECSIQIK